MIEEERIQRRAALLAYYEAHFPNMRRFSTNTEVVSAIMQGFEKEGVSYCQEHFADNRTRSEEYPCGTAFCLLGAIITDYLSQENEQDPQEKSKFREFYLGKRESITSNLAYLFMEEDLANFWSHVFAISSPYVVAYRLAENLPKETADLVDFIRRGQKQYETSLDNSIIQC